MKGQKLPEEEKVHRGRKIPKIIVTENGETEGGPALIDKPRKKGRPPLDKNRGPAEPEWEAIDNSLDREEIEDRIAVSFGVRPKYTG